MNIKEMAKDYAKHNPSIIDGGDGRIEYDYESPRLDYIAGANAVLEKIETYIQNLDLGKSAEEKFHKLDVIADIGLFIKELKGE